VFSSTALLNDTISVLNARVNGLGNRIVGCFSRQPLIMIESVWVFKMVLLG